MAAERRLKKEFNEFIKDPPFNCSGGPISKLNKLDYYLLQFKCQKFYLLTLINVEEG